MPSQHKTVQCPHCKATMRSDNLKKHIAKKHQISDEINTFDDTTSNAVLGDKSSSINDDNDQSTDDDVTESSNDQPIKDESVKQPDNTPSKYAWKERGVEKNHNFLLPRTIRAIIVGPSGAGKTCLTTYLLLQPGMLDYENLTVCGRSLHQPEYRIMRAAFERKLAKDQVSKIFDIQDKLTRLEVDVEDFIENYDGKCRGGIDAIFSDDPKAIPDPESFDPDSKSLLILDDCMLESQRNIQKFYCRGRHNGVCVFYLTQSYFRLDRQTVRENANLFFFFKQDGKNLNHIYQDHVSGDGIEFTDFRDFCTEVWNSGKHCYVVIDKTRPTDCGKFRRNLDEFWVPP